MGKQIRLNQEYAKTDKEILKELHVSALKYNLYAEHKLLFIYRGKSDGLQYKDYEVYFGKENFIHLVGFERDKIGAYDFYEKCKLETLQLHEVKFKESRKAASAKLDAIQNLLDYKYIRWVVLI